MVEGLAQARVVQPKRLTSIGRNGSLLPGRLQRMIASKGGSEMRKSFCIAVLPLIAISAFAADQAVALRALGNEATIVAPEDEVAALVDQAVTLIREKRLAEALPILDAAIAREEKTYANEKRQIFCARSMTESMFYLATAAKLDKDTVVLGPTWATAIFLKGFVLIDMGRQEEAKQYLERAVALSPMNAQYLAELAEWHKSHKDWAKTYELFERASTAAELATPDDAKSFEKRRALRGMGFALIEQGKLDEAEKLYRQCLKLDPNDAGAKGELAYIGELRAKVRAQEN